MDAMVKDVETLTKKGANFLKKPYGLDCDILIKTNGLSHEKWLKARREGITGTDVGAIAEVNKYKSKMQVYLEKVTEEGYEEENEKMYFGRVLEDVVATEFSKRNSLLKVKRVNAILKSRELPFAIANIDRLVTNEKGEKGVLEINTVSEYMKGNWKDDEVPYHYMVQLQWYMFVTGTSYGYFGALIGGNKYIQKYVKRDDELIDMLKEITVDFWENNIVKGEAPKVDGSLGSSRLLNNLYKESNGNVISLGVEAIHLINSRERLKEKVKDIEIEISECENTLKNLLGENEVGVVEDRRVIWKSYERNSLDSKALKRENSEVYNKYLNVCKYRKFEVR